MRTQFLAALFFLTLPSIASALSLEEAKAQGLVGEKRSGYLGQVCGACPPGVGELMSRINAERRKEYTSIASRNGTSVAAVEVLAAEKAIERSAPGHMVEKQGGGWVRR